MVLALSQPAHYGRYSRNSSPRSTSAYSPTQVVESGIVWNGGTPPVESAGPISQHRGFCSVRTLTRTPLIAPMQPSDAEVANSTTPAPRRIVTYVREIASGIVFGAVGVGVLAAAGSVADPASMADAIAALVGGLGILP